ncbi:MAG TPA: SDR family NAD(P)-dependent oxidoreductase [Herpetosiphonaceae bacterium]|nr:SDR family NAD(P)-dependent oxidoreductase [Herpetosiphonaceae bacterium]
MKIKDTIAVVTGASSGIGAATARLLAARRARVVLLARGAGPLEELAGQIKAAGGEAWAYPVDLTDAAAVAGTAARVLAEVGVPHILVNNAGMGRFLAIDETTAAEAAEMMAAPYFAAFHVTHAFLPAMLGRRRGMIVNVTSPASRLPWPGATAYAAARWAMRGFNEALRADLYRTGVSTMLVTPGKVKSAYFANNPGSEERIPAIARISKTLTPEEVAEALVKGVEAGKRSVVTPRLIQVFFVLHALFPRTIEFLVNSTGWKRRRKP